MFNFFSKATICLGAILASLAVSDAAFAQNYYSGQYFNYACVNECNPGDHQCSGNSGRTCREFGSCALWDNYEACDSECYTCGDGSCNSACGESQTSCPRDCGVNSDGTGAKSRYSGQLSSMKVALIISPKTACGSVRGADLAATVSNYGSYDGDYTYYFDCENDGILEKTVTTDEPSYNARDLCDYANVGSYTARVRVESRGRTVTDTDIIKTNDCGNGRYYSNYQNQSYYPAQYNGYQYQSDSGYYPAAAGQTNVQYPASSVQYVSPVAAATAVSTGFGGNEFARIGMLLAAAILGLSLLSAGTLKKKTARQLLADKINFLSKNNIA